MNDEEEAPAEGEEEATAAETEEGGEEEISAIEATAREQRWTPLEEFVAKGGDPEDWVDAEEYVKRANPIYLRKQLNRTEKQLRTMEQQRKADQAAFETRLNKMESLNKVQRRKMYAEIETARRAAVEAGDTEEYDRQNQMEQQLYEAELDAGKAPAKDVEVTKAEKPHPDVEAWVQANPWFEDVELAKAAEGIHLKLMKKEPDLTIKQNLAKVRAEIVKRYPERFTKSPPAKTNGHSTVESGQRAASGPKGKGFADIPAEERKIVEGHIAEGLYGDPKDLAKAKAEAAKAYWS